MGDRNLNIFLALVGLCLISSAVAHSIELITLKRPSIEPVFACPGPIKYYEELGCTPLFKNSNDSCPIRFDCDKWANLTEHQCLVNGHVYEQGEKLRDEDSNPCDDCTCNGSEGWSCREARCFQSYYSAVQGGSGLHCYKKGDPYQCCSAGDYVCVEEKDRPTCVVDGKTYKDGEYFVPSTNPEKQCACGDGYTGENIEPFCFTAKHTWCNHVLRDIPKIRANCIPVYQEDQTLNTDCEFLYHRCQEDEDHVINPKPKSETENPEMLCKFGNMTMQIGEELNYDKHARSCLKCVCELPPIPTCQHTFSQAECSLWQPDPVREHPFIINK